MDIEKAREASEKLREYVYRVAIVDATVFNLLDQLGAALAPDEAPAKKKKADAGAE